MSDCLLAADKHYINQKTFRLDDCGQCRYCLDKKRFGGPGKKNKRCKLRMCLTPKNLGDPSTTPETYHQRKAKIQIQPSDEKMRVSSSSSSTLDEEEAELLNHPSTFVHINSEKRQKTQTSRQEPHPQQPPALSISPAFRDTLYIPSRSIWAQPTSLGPAPVIIHNSQFWSPEPEYDKICAKPVTKLLSEEESFKIKRSVETKSNNSQQIFCPNCR